jgi:formylglycine-generating enzyme required for sulfatase activity
VTGTDGRGHGARVHRLKKSVVFTDVVNVLLKDAQGDRLSEIVAAPTASIGSPTSQQVVEPGPVELDVTADIQAWADGMRNHGWAFLPWRNGTDGWGFLKPDCPNAAERPSLTFTYIPPPTGATPAAVKSAGAKPPGPAAAEAVKTNARALRGKAKSTHRQGDGTAKTDLAVPYRVATSGLAGTKFIAPLATLPYIHNFDQPDTWERWATPNDFGRLTTMSALAYPLLPVSRFVCEFEVTSNASGGMSFSFGDLSSGDLENGCQIGLNWVPERKIIRCWLAHWYKPKWYLGGERTFDPNRRISLKLVVGDGRQTLFHENNPILSSACWPVDCQLRIFSEAPDSGIIHRISLRPLTAQDVSDCHWTNPPTELRLDAGKTSLRLAKISEGYPAKPTPGQRFALKATGTPMAWIAPGEFEMGIPNWNNDPFHMPRHRVRITNGYWVSQTEVTQGEFTRVMGANPSRVKGSLYLPVDWVTWYQAMAYCQRLTRLERKSKAIPPGYEFRLPTEAEWEYGARAGSDADVSVPKNLAWSNETSGSRPHEVAETQPNKWGLYDMHGNAMEWCFDAWYEVPKGTERVAVNPFKIGNPETDTFVVRGGAWWSGPHMCTSYFRAKNHSNANGFRGFRVVLAPEIRGARSGTREDSTSSRTGVTIPFPVTTARRTARFIALSFLFQQVRPCQAVFCRPVPALPSLRSKLTSYVSLTGRENSAPRLALRRIFLG